jgi:4-diphosphocytidyl-2-C-methyl-D-erythritol kinase
MTTLTRQAHAKVNLALDVLSRRPDGYHEVRMVMHTIDLYDELIFEKTPIKSESEAPAIVVQTAHPALQNEQNLVYRAAALLCQHFPGRILTKDSGVTISLEKNIPLAAGLAGGSADAAATFHGLNELFDLKMSLAEMCELGSEIGADVPFCLIGGTVLAEGIGDELTPLPPLPPCEIRLAKPAIEVSTKWVYQNLSLAELEQRPNIEGMIAALQSHDLEGVAARMGNVLETVTIKEYPVIEEIKQEMLAKGALNALMSGSGPTVFGVFYP